MVDIYSDEELRKMGDINGDGIIDMKDVDLFKAAWESGRYEPACDFNGDGVVDAHDLATLGHNYGKVSTKYFTKRLTFSVPAPIIFGAVLTVLSR